MKTILITGSSGFIGSNLCEKLLKEETDIKLIGIDNMNDYYDTNLKDYRLNNLNQYDNFIFIKGDISNKEFINKVFDEYKPNIVVNLAAQAGVRYSIEKPDAYINSNIIGFYNILETCKKNPVEHLIYTSSSSIYGDNKDIPYKEEINTDYPVSLYAATKKCDEVLAYSYSNMYNIPCTGLRLFTVYGPNGREDMAYFDFTKKMINKEEIKVFNKGNLRRDFTYIDDIVESIKLVIDNKPKKLYNIYNVGNENPIELIDFIKILYNQLLKEGLLNKDYNLNDYLKYVDMQKGDVYETYSDTSKFYNDFNYKPKTNIEEGLNKFIKWYKEYYLEK